MKAYIYEVYEELGRIPEHVVLPVGNGTLFIGAVKALEHPLESGAIDHFPKIVALQSEYCDPLLKARELGLDAPVSRREADDCRRYRDRQAARGSEPPFEMMKSTTLPL